MKNHRPLGLLALCIAVVQSLSAQQPVSKTVLERSAFSKLPQKFECASSALQKASRSKLLENISMQFGELQFAGQVVDKVQRPELVSMNIRLTNYPGALLTLSVVIDEDKTERLVGRIINPNDDYVLLLKEENNRYFFVKEPKEYFMTE